MIKAHLCKSLYWNSVIILVMFVGQIGTLFANPKPKVIIQATQGMKGFSRLVALDNGLLLACTQPKNIRLFDPQEGVFFETVYTLTNYSFPDDLTLIPDGYSIASFLDGRIPTVNFDGKVIESNYGEFIVQPVTGIFQATVNPQLEGANPIAYRPSNGMLYTQGFDVTTLYSLDPQGSVPAPVALSPATALEGFAFGPNDLLYSPDIGNGQIVTVDVDTGVVTPIAGTQGLIFPVDLKIDSQGNLYYLERPTGNVYKYNIQTAEVTLLVSGLAPALEKVCISLDETKLYVTNDENRIVEVDIATGNTRIIFDSPIIQPWGVAYDRDSDTLYVADTGSLKQFTKKGELIRSLVIDSMQSGLLGTGQVNAISLDKDTITICDLTLGDIMVVNKETFTVHDVLSSNLTGLIGMQPFSAVRINDNTGEYYLVANGVEGSILKVLPGASEVTTFFTGLDTPVKLKLSEDGSYLYVVDAGQLRQGVPNSGRIGRINLASPTTFYELVGGLGNPQGLDFYNGQMLTVETDHGTLISASTTEPGQKHVIAKGLELSHDLFISELVPNPINPLVSVAIAPKGKVYINETGPNRISLFKVDL